MTKIFSQTFRTNGIYGDQMALITTEDATQTFAFFSETNRPGGALDSVGMFEILINENLDDASQLVILNDDLSFIAPIDKSNQGSLNIGTGAYFLMAVRDSFTAIKGYTMCGYSNQLGSQGGIYCEALPSGSINLDPFNEKIVTCETNLVNPTLSKKRDFICNIRSSQNQIFYYSSMGVVAIGLIVFIVAIVIMCKERKKWQQQDVALAAARAANGVAPSVAGNALARQPRLDPEAQERLDAQNRKIRMTLISNQLLKLKFSSSKNKVNQESCCICVEEFQSNTMVRETPCKHIFHEACIMKWIETKVAAPDCPFCRTEIKIA